MEQKKFFDTNFLFLTSFVIIDLLECEHMFENIKNNLLAPIIFPNLNIFYKIIKIFVTFC